MYKKIIAYMMALLVAIGFGGSTASAISLTSGQSQYYTVQLRDDERVIVYAKLVFQNGDSDSERSTFSFKLPDGVEITNLSVQQILAKTDRKCLVYAENDNRYNPECLEYSEAVYDEDFDYTNGTSSYGWYYDYYYYNSRYADHYDYVDLEASLTGDTYTVNLDTAIKSHKQGAVLVSYISSSFVKIGSFGRFNYDFKTFKSDELIDKVNVAINFDGGLYSREASQERSAETSNDMGSIAEAADSSYGSKTLDNMIYSVGAGGVYTKTQSTMLPDDVMVVSGVYSTNRMSLYLNEIVITVLVLLVLAFSIWFGIRLNRRKNKKNNVDNKKTDEPAAVSETAETRHEVVSQHISFWRMLAISGISIISTAAVLGLIIAAMAMLGGRYYSAFYAIQSALSAVVLSASSIVIMFVLPLIHVFKYGRRTAMAWLIVHMAVIIVIFLLFSVIYYIFSSGTPSYYPYI